jgi:zinc D-Ala-D-Ala dipeptidase
MIPVRILAALALATSALPAQDRPAIFRITPARPVAELRAEAIAATPATEAGPFRPADLVDLARLDSRIKLEIRYATRDNFLGTPVYTQAQALLRAHRALLQQG